MKEISRAFISKSKELYEITKKLFTESREIQSFDLWAPFLEFVAVTGPDFLTFDLFCYCLNYCPPLLTWRRARNGNSE